MRVPININSIYRRLLLVLLATRLKLPFLASVSLILCIIGGRAAAGPTLIIISFILISVVILLITFNFEKKCYYSLILYLISLTLLFGTTLPSNYLIGSDIHIEYYFARLTQLHGWDASLAYNMNSSLSITLLAPFLADLFHIEIEWVFKLIFPALFACVPVILYLIYRQFLSYKAAFLAAIFFIIVPTFFTEIAAITRQQIATLFLVITLYFILSKNEYLPKICRESYWRRVPLIFTAGMLAIVSHYTTGALLMVFLGASVLIVAIAQRYRMPLEIPLRVLAAAAGAVIVGGVIYYGSVSSGTALHDLIAVLPYGERLQAMLPMLSPEIAPPQLPPGTVIPADGPGIGGAVTPHSQLMQAALGLDFLGMSPWGQVFRIFQFLTQLVFIMGVIYFLIRTYKGQFWAVYASFLLVSCGLLAMCVIKPGFSALINASRFYHYALIFAAPAIVLSAQLISRKIPKLNTAATGYAIIFAAITIPYMFFTTGIIFEATKQPDITRFDMPYSVALSSHRLDLWGNYTPDDEKVRKFITRSGDNPILTDIYGRVFLQETIGYTKSIYLLPRDLENIPDEYHIFLRSANVETQSLAHWVGAGLKEYVPADLPGAFKGRKVLYQSGNSIYLSKGGE